MVYEPLRIPMWREGGTHEHDEDGSGAPAMVRLGRGTGGLASSGLGFEHTRVGDAMVGKGPYSYVRNVNGPHGDERLKGENWSCGQLVSGQSGPAMYPASKCRMGLPQARSGTLCLSRWRWANLCRYVGTVPEGDVRGGPSAKGAATLMNCRDVGLYGWMRFFKATFIQARPPNRIDGQTLMLTDFLLLFV